MAQNLYTNSSFEDGAAFNNDVTAPPNFVNGALIPDWRLVCTAGSAGNFAVVSEASAPDGAQVLQFGRATATGNFRIDRWATPAPIVAGRAYKHSFWIRKITGEADAMHIHPFGMTGLTQDPWFENGRFDYQVAGLTQNVWEKHEAFASWPDGAGYSCPYIVADSTGPIYQLDNFMLEDASQMDLCPNGRFENADRLIGWLDKLTPASVDNLAGSSITTNAADVAEGAKALHVVKNQVTAGDTLIRSTPVPWTDGHTAYVAYSIKNDPSIGADSHVEFLLRTFDGATEGIALGHLSGGAFDGGYLRREFEVPVNVANLEMVYIDMRLRSASNQDDTPEALFVDFVSLGDMTAGGVPVEMSTFTIE